MPRHGIWRITEAGKRSVSVYRKLSSVRELATQQRDKRIQDERIQIEQEAQLINTGTRDRLSKINGIVEPVSQKSKGIIASDSIDTTFRQKPAPPTPKALDLAEPPKRAQATVNRICRDTMRARRVKQLHEYRCQIKGCRHRIKLPEGLYYAEAHHIQPLGGDHKGHDIEANIMCVCPHHQAQLDLGVIDISLTDLRKVDGHEIAKKYVDYYNNFERKRWQKPK